jgi:hypothetical protein
VYNQNKRGIPFLWTSIHRTSNHNWYINTTRCNFATMWAEAIYTACSFCTWFHPRRCCFVRTPCLSCLSF